MNENLPDILDHEYEYPEVREVPRILWAVEPDDFIGEINEEGDT